MKEISSKLNRNHIAIFFIAINFIGLFSSRILMSNGMIWFFALSIIPNSFFFYISKSKEEYIPLKERLMGFILYKPFLAQTFIVLVALIGCIYSQDVNYSIKTLINYTPFLFIPIAFGAIKPFTKKQFVLVLYMFNLVVFIAVSGIIINYLFNYNKMNDGLSKGHAIVTPYHEHIRYSLMLCFAICSLIYLRLKKYFIWNYKKESIIQIIITFILGIFIHVLSVRSGLVSLYACLFILAIYMIFFYKKYFIGFFFILIIVTAPIVSYYTISSVKNKISYMLWDLEQMKNNNSKNYSDAERITSIVAGYKIAKANMFFGVGTGDIKNEMNKIYDQDYKWIDKNNRKMPHNQWVWLWASNGILGVIALLLSIVISLFNKHNYKNILLICFFIISISSFLYEHTLQTQVGVAFYVMCLLIILNFLRGKENVDENRI